MVRRSSLRSTIIAIVGPNATGKSDLGIYLAREFQGEIVSADARQVFRKLDIGTGKVSKEQQRIVPHHLLDVIDVGEPFSVAAYQTLAYKAINSILKRGHLPFLVGGTGLYLEAVIDGYEFVAVPPSPELRQQMESRAEDDLINELWRLDPIAAANIQVRNKRRIIRAIEIATSGYKYEDSRRTQRRYSTLQLGVSWPRQQLYERIDERLDRRLKNGMVEEVRDLLRQGVSEQLLHDLGLEYRHVLMFIKGEYSTMDALYDGLRHAIHSFARRQLTWFNQDKRIHWLDTSSQYYEEAVFKIENYLQFQDIVDYLAKCG